MLFGQLQIPNHSKPNLQHYPFPLAVGTNWCLLIRDSLLDAVVCLRSKEFFMKMSSRSIPLPSHIKSERDGFIEKQGIVSILGSDFEVNKIPPSLRRTISADMSSKKWLAQNGFSSMKRIASSGELAAAVSSDELNNIPGQDDVWRSIQLQNEKKDVQLDVWSSIITEKNNDTNNLQLPPLYIHPLVKRSSSTLSEKSLEICTESLGSETGSEGFSSYPPPPSESCDIEYDTQIQITHSFEELQVVKYNSKLPSKKMAPKSFPPPLPSIAKGDGASLHMQSQRRNGRLVLQAVSVPQRNCFHAQREQGRLLLTLVNSPTSQDPISEKTRSKTDLFANEEEEEGVEKQNDIKEIAFPRDQSSVLPGMVMNVHISTLTMKSIMALHYKDPTRSIKLNKTANLAKVEEPMEKLPLTPMVAETAASFNAYEYFWREKLTMASVINTKDNKIVLSKTNNNKRENELHGAMLTRENKADYMVPMLRGCNDNRRSLLFSQPYCVATS